MDILKDETRYYVTGQEENTVQQEPAIGDKDKDNSIKRYVVENEYLPPIFGSFKYNAISHQFDLPVEVHITTQYSTGTMKNTKKNQKNNNNTLKDVFDTIISTLGPGRSGHPSQRSQTKPVELQINIRNPQTGLKSIIRANINSMKNTNAITDDKKQITSTLAVKILKK